MKKNCRNVADVAGAAAEAEGSLGTGTEPKTFAPLVFVVFNTDELILQFQFKHHHIYVFRFLTIFCCRKRETKITWLKIVTWWMHTDMFHYLQCNALIDH